MIKNWNQHSLYMDFSNIKCEYGRPSDIDMFYLGKNNTLILGEIKNETGSFNDGQRHLFEHLIDNWKYNGACFFITHNEYVEHDSSTVDVSKCYVKEYYYNKRWHTPLKPTTVNEAIEKFTNKENE